MKKRLLVQIVVTGTLLLLFSNNIGCSIQSAATSKTLRNVPASFPPQDSSTNETHYFALICACAYYEISAFNIPASDKKLKVLSETLLKTSNWDKDNILVLLNQEATKQNIINALVLMASKVGPNDIFLFTWNGHGSEIPDTNGDEAVWDPDDTYDEIICPYDINMTNESYINIITDDELGWYISNIHAKGKFLIFESCLSGALVDKTNKTTYSARVKASIAKNGPTQDNTHLETMDVNDENTVVIMSTLPSTLGLVSLLTHAPLIYSIATTIRNGERYDSNKDGYLSAEEIFEVARPKMMVQSSLRWFSMALGVYFFFKLDLYRVYFFIPPMYIVFRAIDKFVSVPIVLAVLYTLWAYVFQQISIKRYTNHFFLNWPTIKDDFPGELPIVHL